jgi:DNA replication protein DnaC
MTCADSGSELPLGEPHNVTGNKQARTNRPIGEIPKSTGLVSAQLIDSAMTDFTASGFQVDRALVHRFVASLLTKRFVILTGLSGSGKTKLAQALAAWMTSTSVQEDV